MSQRGADTPPVVQAIEKVDARLKLKLAAEVVGGAVAVDARGKVRCHDPARCEREVAQRPHIKGGAGEDGEKADERGGDQAPVWEEGSGICHGCRYRMAARGFRLVSRRRGRVTGVTRAASLQRAPA